MDGDSFNPQLFVNFIKLLNELNEIHQDCADASDTLFQTGERIPLWARQNTAEIKDDTVAIMQSNERNWNKVIVMDPPKLSWDGEVLEPNDCEPGEYSDEDLAVNGSMMVKQGDTSFASRVSQARRKQA